MLEGLPADFRSTWTRTATRIPSEHDRFIADVYAEGDVRFAEDLFFRDAAAGVYLLEHGDGGVRFAVADPAGRTVADTSADAGPSLAACAACHTGGTVFRITAQ